LEELVGLLDVKTREAARMIERLTAGLLVGGAATSIPWLLRNHEALWPVNFLTAPGMIVAVLLAGGNIHNYSLSLALVANVGLYALATYFFPRRWGK
jgi:hypothetical protein